MKEKQEEAETGDGLVSNVVNQGRMITFRGEMMATQVGHYWNNECKIGIWTNVG